MWFRFVMWDADGISAVPNPLKLASSLGGPWATYGPAATFKSSGILKSDVWQNLQTSYTANAAHIHISMWISCAHTYTSTYNAFVVLPEELLLKQLVFYPNRRGWRWALNPVWLIWCEHTPERTDVLTMCGRSEAMQLETILKMPLSRISRRRRISDAV